MIIAPCPLATNTIMPSLPMRIVEKTALKFVLLIKTAPDPGPGLVPMLSLPATKPIALRANSPRRAWTSTTWAESPFSSDQRLRRRRMASHATETHPIPAKASEPGSGTRATTSPSVPVEKLPGEVS
jgi:hypothetical protein